MNSYRLTKRAETELLDIFLYGIEQFGLAQARLYSDDMARCFQLLSDTPLMGRPALTIADGVRRPYSAVRQIWRTKVRCSAL